MFTRIDLLPRYSPEDHNKYTSRWDTSEGRTLREKILKMIRGGAGEDFLQWEYEQGRSGFLESMWDLKGLTVFKEDIDFPTADNFEAIDFSYASFYHSKFKNATFFNSHSKFIELVNCEFINCVFSFTSFYGTTLERVKFTNCDFIDHNSFTNCNLRKVKFENCFASMRVFFDCKFDEQTIINDPLDKALIMSEARDELSKTEFAEIFKGIKDGYRAGNVIKQARQYLFKEKQSITRYNPKGLRENIFGFFLELIAGYGMKPLRVMLTMLTMFLILSAIFITKLGFSEGLLLSAGGFFTFGANTQYLSTVSGFLKVVYVAESFCGIFLMALFIIVLANLWFSEK